MARHVARIGAVLGFLMLTPGLSSQTPRPIDLHPGKFTGTFQNSLGHSGPDELVVTQIQGSHVTGSWSGFPFQGSLTGDVLEFTVLKQVNGCRDYKVRVEFARDGSSARSSYSVTDRCGPGYSGTQSLQRAGGTPEPPKPQDPPPPPPPGGGTIPLLPGKFIGTYENSLGRAGPDELVLQEVRGAEVRGAWSTFPFQGKLSGSALQFVILNQTNGCRDYNVRLVFSSDGNSATSTYAVTDRCGPPYRGTQNLKRVETLPSPPPPPPPPSRALDLNGSWTSGLLHIWQNGKQVLVTATWKRDGKYCIWRGEGELNGRIANLRIQYSPMTHGDLGEWRAVFTVSEDGNTIEALYTQGTTADRKTYGRDR